MSLRLDGPVRDALTDVYHAELPVRIDVLTLLEEGVDSGYGSATWATLDEHLCALQKAIVAARLCVAGVAVA